MAVTIQQIIDSKSYVWTLKKQACPKTRKYWIDEQSNMVLIDPEIVAGQLEAAKTKLSEAKKAGKSILVICEKGIYREEIAEICAKQWIHYLNYKIPAWVLTNFDTFYQRIKSMNELQKFIETEEFLSLTKKERASKVRELKKVELVYKWVKSLQKKPDLVIVVDGTYNAKFVDELEKTKTDNIVLASTNFDRWWKEESLVMTNVSYYDSLDLTLKYILN